ncbi:baculoviral IAP repeat-containing protein 3-like [Mercenaria mercenaria]|uniref:baculoviral IAP repeat-containing protein 3-like n=1 Tax=Mercenaria mercenaria TaxID=6596 RepID=UPI00234F67B1|nr:baculoviral IAP repeat-containing protein 3-like [Mercenaria mercenaria]
MDSSMDTLTEVDSCLLEMLLETELTASNIESIFSVIVSGKYCFKKRVLFRLKQNKLTIGLLSQITSKMEQILFDSGISLANTETASLLKTFSEKREMLIFSVFGKLVLVTKNEILELLGINIKRKLDEGVLIKRRIDFDIFIALLIVKTANGEEAGSYSTTMLKDAPKLSPVFPRIPHTTTLVDLEIIVFPYDRNQYNRPKYPEKYLTQVTETNARQSSFEHYPRHAASGSIGSGFSGVEQTNVYSAPDISYDRQTAINSNVVTSGHRAQIHTKPPRYPDYMEQQKRQASFSTPRWSVDNKPEPFLLAECGFFFTGNQDLVRCHQCGIGLKDWVREDDVLTEHVKHSSSCDFIVKKFGKNRIDRIKLALTSDDNNEIVSIASHKLPYKIRSPRYKTREARLLSFISFPQHIQVPVQQLAVAGLFYTGSEDLCRCFTCDGGLKDWGSGDDPIKEHATYFPNCSYIIRLKGPEYIKCQQQSRQSYKPMGTSGGNSAITQPKLALSNHSMNNLPETDSDYSSFNVSEVVQKLRYLEVEVNTAKAEQEMKDSSLHVSQDDYNLEYSVVEVNTANAELEMKENEQYKKRLTRCTSTFVEKMSPELLLDKLHESRFLTYVEKRDIQETPLTSEKNRAILRKIMMKGKRGYTEFKDCLRQCNQGHLADLLEREEN